MTGPEADAREPSLWERQVAKDPGHSQWYIERFRGLAADGVDIVGEARLIDAMIPRGSRVLDAGCGPGRLGGYLHTAGHHVVGVDVDPALIEAARQDHPGPRWQVADLSTLELGEFFDAIVCAGNVMTFVAPSTRRAVLTRLAAHLRPGGQESPAGRLVVGFGSGRGYPFAEFETDVTAAGLAVDHRFATWDLQPFTTVEGSAAASDFLVAVLRAAR
ncbi:MAG: class I SAM-dependent methyltransferase [Actinomycetales bacterium]